LMEKTLPAGSTETVPEDVLRATDVKVFFTKKEFLQKGTVVKAVDGISLAVKRGEILALVGESGSGKTTLGRVAIGLVKPTAGSVKLLDGAEQDVGAATGTEWKEMRKKLQMIFQDPFSSIDPNMRVYDALRIPLAAQGVRAKDLVHAKVADVMKRVGLPEQIVNNYVFQLSGGQRQRVGIARVLLFDPLLVVADEPVSMLDASLKGDILHIIEKESKDNGVAFLIITHDMAVAKVVANRIAVMYLGEVDEIGPADDVVSDALHPYTKAMLEASPVIRTGTNDEVKEVHIIGELPMSTAHPSGCKFHPRCPYAMEICKTQKPLLKEAKPEHFVACWLY
jgi:oligopeptide/dipeptide ABC transporter ATP-binding protein